MSLGIKSVYWCLWVSATLSQGHIGFEKTSVSLSSNELNIAQGIVRCISKSRVSREAATASNWDWHGLEWRVSSNHWPVKMPNHPRTMFVQLTSF